MKVSFTGKSAVVDSVARASARVAAVANDHVRFEVADLNTYHPSTSYDAVVGRFVLPYLDDPTGVLQRLASHVRPGGVVAFMEFDVTCIESVPEAPLFKAMAGWITGAFRGSDIDPAMGSDVS